MPKESILKIIADNSALMEELRKVFRVEFETRPVELVLSNEQLGERERARLEGLLAVDRAMQKISGFGSSPVRQENKNPAR